MTTHAYLDQIDRYDRLIYNKRLQIAELRGNATNITVPTDSEKVKSSGNKDKIGSMAVLIADLETDISNIEKKKVTIQKQIESIENVKQYDTLMWFYILHKDLYDISDHLGCSLSNVKKIKSAAMKSFEAKYGDTYINSVPNYTNLY